MSPQDLQALEQRDRTQQQIAEERHLDGCNDAGFGKLPQYQDEAYLGGYLATIRTLPTDSDGRIQHYSHYQHFAFGYVDSPDPDHRDEL
ncbi:MAG: hypothetical protein KME42_03680 [Tildeniella nuda ZEHNDER 1965/U140]|jgi:hypothetical protein|nr:hypothetical protein [Tildeniella nuda ZEHNDER 1965/U140]